MCIESRPTKSLSETMPFLCPFMTNLLPLRDSFRGGAGIYSCPYRQKDRFYNGKPGGTRSRSGVYLGCGIARVYAPTC